MRYVVTSPLTLPAGLVIGLDPKQAELRAHALEEAGKGQYRTLAPIDLKAGEVIRADALPKALWPMLKESPRPARLEQSE
jgi:hypothetical protein